MHSKFAYELRDGFIKGHFSATEVTRCFLERIEKLDKDIGAFITLLSDKAMKRALEIDAKKASGANMGMLAGVPIAIKNNINVYGEIVTCGSKFLSNHRAYFDATVVKLIQEEDGIIVGFTNMDEFAMGSSTEHSAYHKTKNPIDLSRSPGGSSGGSAASVCAGLTPIAFGSDTGGSVRQPGALTGTYGLAPTYGIVSRYGLVAFGSSFDRIGPLANCVKDIALSLDVVGKFCKNDPSSIHSPHHNYVDGLKEEIDGLRVGIPWSFLDQLSLDSKLLFNDVVSALNELGASVVDVDMKILKYSVPAYYILSNAEAASNLARFTGICYGNRSENAKTLDEVYTMSRDEGFGDEVKRRILLGTFVLSAGHKDAFYKRAQRVRQLIWEKYKLAFAGCDLILLPTSPSYAFKLGEICDPLSEYLQDLYTVGPSMCGLPALSMPCGRYDNGLPFGVQLVACRLHEHIILNVAKALESKLAFKNLLIASAG